MTDRRTGSSGRGRWFVIGLVALAAAFVVFGHGIDHPNRPSIILIMVDTLRADYLGTYGFEGDISPNLDRLAEESVLFERCYAQAPWTKPSIASLFTSLHPMTHNVLSHKGRYMKRGSDTDRTDALSDEATTIAESLREAGYATAALVANPWILPDQGFGQGFDHFDGSFAGNTTTAEVVFTAARAWLKSRPADRPFFLYLHLMDVHGPYTTPDDDFAALRDSPSLGTDRPLTESELKRFRRYLARVPWIRGEDARQLRTWRGRYAAGVRAFDRRLGPFLDDLRTTGVLDEAALVVTADHGEELLDHGGWDHGYNLHEHQLRVPLMIRAPGPPRAVRRIHETVELLDVMPTLVAMAGTRTPVGLHGRDLSPLLEGLPELERPRSLLASGVKWAPTRHALRLGPHKLITTLPNGPLFLFDVEQDPTEQRDLALEQPDAVLELLTELDRHLTSPAFRARFARKEVAVPPSVEERLEQLGYVER